MKQTLISALHAAWTARERCKEKDLQHPAIDMWDERIEKIKELLPRGSGFDNGTQIDQVCDNVIAFVTSFHNMDEHGGYVGWSHYRVSVRPAFDGIDLTVTGQKDNLRKYNRDNIDYIAEVFHTTLTQEIEL